MAFYKYWEALSLLEFLGYSKEDPQPPLTSPSLLLAISTPVDLEECSPFTILEEDCQSVYCTHRPDSPLSPLFLCNGWNGQYNCSSLDIGVINPCNSNPEDYLDDDHGLSSSPVENHLAQSPIPLSPTSGFSSVFVSPSITEFSTEILLEIFRYLAIADESSEETASPLVLERLRLVCRRWREVIDTHCRGRFLVATPGFLVQDCKDWPPHSSQFDAWCKMNYTGSALDVVSFYLCNWFASTRYTVNLDHARMFTQALMKCRTARIVIDLTDAQLDEDFTGRTTSPAIPLRNFSWTSEHMGIRHILPEIYRFPWLTLRHDMPWQQLTYVDLDCPLSLWDAHHVLAYGTNITDARLSTVKVADDLDQDCLPFLHPTPVSPLRSLTICSQLDLHMLFSNVELPNLTFFSLSILHPHSALGLVFQDSNESFLDLSLNVPWPQIEGLDIHYESSQVCDVAHILSNCCQLRRLTLAGHLIVGKITNFVRRLDHFTLDDTIVWDSQSNSFKETIIKKLQITHTPSGFPPQSLRVLRAVEGLSILGSIDLSVLLQTLAMTSFLRVGNFQVMNNSSAITTPLVTLVNLRRLEVATSKELIQFVSATLRCHIQIDPVCIVSVHE